ncbi:murein biosynthesis integral membrane protein MurJ [Nocardia seriolae]|uniref:Integral membrane protein MviN n=1 Tax=Nocardia seriolae TaxID=37332 RepID=A0ABC9YZ39_9NOCA|nr:lipid II flippase MurJ [Nocardia seriolae]WKY49310.1 lipid II flippase MurJ [Nocardia seriolae]WNJ62466.1 lipid II flippase MurJ [Nocardia seriolae]BEK88451.1 murein biosynthesis integral membrane protein MurJ [Nocardia seriolae]BEK96205.1 murein biosynthesis integral membrane protein MurJ [Nocardia seriolae]GAM48676.1 integral membrane protein MviN [Nocardia seriolae]
MSDYGSFPTQPLPTQPLPVRRGAGLARAGRGVAVASTISRATGFARTIAVAAVLGTAAVGDAYNGANNLPNMVYELLLGGVLASAVVPLLARRRGRPRSREFTQRILVAAVLMLAVVTVLTVACAPLIVRAFIADAGQRRLATALAYLLLPQIFFYGVSVVVGAVLNVRDSFAAAAWAPVVNNLVVLATCGIFVLVPGPLTLTPAAMTTAQILTIGLGTTAGIAAQAGWTVAALRHSGFRWSWRARPLPYTWRPVRAAVPIAGWLLVYAAISQLGVAVTMRVAFDHGGVSINAYADLLFQVPYGILAASLLTVLMPRIARAAAVGDERAVITDLARGARYLSTALIPVTVALSLLGPGFATLVFTGRVDPAAARLIGTAVACSAFGLGPFALVMLQMRVFYAHNDTRTPTLINLAMVTTKVCVLALAVSFLPPHAVIVMLSIASSSAYTVGAATAHLLLRRRHGLLGFTAVAAAAHRVVRATAIAGASGFAAIVLTGTTITTPNLAHPTALAAGTLVGSAAFLAAAKVIGIPEIRTARTLLTRV